MLPGSDGISTIAEMAPPATFTGIRRFLGASGYFRHFIKNYARIAKPLNDLLGCENSKLKQQPVTLGPEALEAFGKLKLKCITAPVLAFANFNKPFLLETDASGDGLGAVLSQKLEDNKFHPVAYASRGLKGSESNYHSSKLEFLALKWAVTDQFKEYLQYRPFTVKTDNHPLTYILTTPNLDATGHRWVAALAQFDMKIEYLRGADNKVADALSRVESRLDEATVKELMEKARHSNSPRAEADHPNLIARHEEIDKQTRDKDKEKSTLHEYLTGKVPSFEAAEYGKRENSFVLFRNLLYTRDMPKNSNEKVLLFVVPVSKRQAAIDLCHRDTGHQGRDRSYELHFITEGLQTVPDVQRQEPSSTACQHNLCQPADGFGSCGLRRHRGNRFYIKEAGSTETTRHCRPLLAVRPDVQDCRQDSLVHGEMPVRQLLLTFWISPVFDVGPGERILQWHHRILVYLPWYQEDTHHSIPPPVKRRR